MLSDKTSWFPQGAPVLYLPIRRCDHLNFLYCIVLYRHARKGSQEFAIYRLSVVFVANLIEPATHTAIELSPT
jgi:hypothetical protein